MKILVTGHEGQLAQSLRERSSNAMQVVTLGRPQLDIADIASVEKAIADCRPDVVVNAAAYTAVDRAESEASAAFAVNAVGAENVARAAAKAGLPIIHVSTDYVFDGTAATPYRESDATAPQSVYGHSKLEGEKKVAAANPAHVIFRTAWVYSVHGHNFLKTMLRLAADRPQIRVVADQLGTPTYAPDIAAGIQAAIERIAADPSASSWRGVFHLVAAGEASWAGFAREIFNESVEVGGPGAEVVEIGTADYPTPARRPANSRLCTQRFEETFGLKLPAWQDGVRRCVRRLYAADQVVDAF